MPNFKILGRRGIFYRFGSEELILSRTYLEHSNLEKNEGPIIHVKIKFQKSLIEFYNRESMALVPIREIQQLVTY